MIGTDDLDGRYSWMRLAVTLAIATVGNVGMWSIIVILPAVQAEFDTARADAALPYTATMIGFALGNLLIGHAVDRFGVTAALIGAAGLTGAGSLLAAISPSILILSLVQFVIGIGTAASFGPLITDISHWFLRRRSVGFVIMATIVGMALGGWMSGWIYDVTESYRMAFLNGITWNGLNIAIMLLILTRTRRRGGIPVAAAA
jgi:MFS family permease